MNEWLRTSLGSIAAIRFSNVDKKEAHGEVPIRLCNYLDVYCNDYITHDLAFMEATATHAEIERFRVEKGDVLVTKDSETPDDIGIPAVVIDQVDDLLCGYHLALIKPNRDKVDSVFLAKQLGCRLTASYFSRLANGSTRYGLSSSSIASTPVWLPPLGQQRRIAEILSTLDETIEQTEALIAKYQQIKAGLMHDLFTRGVTPDGKLRPTHTEAPQLYKESPVGWIPKEWEVRRLVDLISFPSGQVDPRQPSFAEWILVAPDYIEKDTGRLLGMQTAREQGAISGKYVFQCGDIVYSKIRPYLRKAILADFPGLCSADMYPLRAVSGVNSRYLLGVILGDDFSRFAESVSMRSGFPKINRHEMSGYRFAVPPSREQEIIANILLTYDSLLTRTQEQVEKLRQQKHGLMHDLLTGRVRVKVDD